MPNPHRRRSQYVFKSMGQHWQKYYGSRLASKGLKYIKGSGEVVNALRMILCDFATCCYSLVYAACLYPMQERHTSKLHLQFIM